MCDINDKKAKYNVDLEPNIDRCICCGNPIPEGMAFCPDCLKKERRFSEDNPYVPCVYL